MLLCHEHRIAMIKKRDEKGKQNKQKLKKQLTFSSTAGARHTIPTKLTW